MTLYLRQFGLDTRVDKINNALVLNKYIPAINALNKTYNNAFSYSIEIIKLMNIFGYAIPGPNDNPTMIFLPIESVINFTQILDCYIH